MYILYVDDAGSVGNPEERHYILGGVGLFERQIWHLEQALESVAIGTALPEPESLEFHGNEILAGRRRWRALGNRERRAGVIVEALECLARLRGRAVLFGIVVNKAAVSPRDPIEFAFEQLCSRFDHFLARTRRDGQAQRGLIVVDRSTRETRLQSLVTEFRRSGHSWGVLRNVVDVPFFVDSKATRAIQFADLVSYALWRRFEKQDDRFFRIVRHKFDQSGGVVHGLLHERYADSQCDCPYCDSRRQAR